MEQTQDQQPIRPTRPPTSGPAVEDHGRAVTANRQAAAWYREAQNAVDCRRAITALRLAVLADPAFGLAAVDLYAITAVPPRRVNSRLMSWERHHCEVICTAATGDAIRAEDLLREHLANVGCDPLGYRIAAHLRHEVWGRAEKLPNCHPTTWKCCHDSRRAASSP